MFHEFGHALHGMFSNVEYPLFAGTSVPADFVEFPSQFNEMWSRDPKVLTHFARHYQTGEPMPQTLVEKTLAASRFNQGYHTSEYLAATRPSGRVRCDHTYAMEGVSRRTLGGSPRAFVLNKTVMAQIGQRGVTVIR
jgi:hypothetical protein